MAVGAAGDMPYPGQLKVHDLCNTIRHGGVRDNRLVAGEIVNRKRGFNLQSNSVYLLYSQENRHNTEVTLNKLYTM